MHANQSQPPSTSDRAAARLAIDLRSLPWVRRLAGDYAYQFDAVAPFFSGNPSAPGAWSEAIARAQNVRRPRAEVVEILGRQQQGRQAPARAIEAARQLGDPRTVAIVTGQQAGLFGGPLFTLLKAVTAIGLAQSVTRTHGVPTVPIFWVESEDHDWDEVRSCAVFDDELTTRTVSLPARGAVDPVPVAAVQLDDHVVATLNELEAALPATEFRVSLLSNLRLAYAPGRGMAEAFARWLERVFGDRGLVVYDASDPSAKPLAGEVFAREVSMPGQTARLSAAAGARLVERGYHAQVAAHPDSVALFHLDAGRRPIRQDADQFVIGDEHLSAHALADRIATRPSAFSPSVLLRPIVQDTIFPTACYVAGPNELAYLAQLRDVYEHFQVPMPLMYPRATATIVDSSAWRFLTKYRVPFEALQPRDEAALNDLLASQIPPAVEESFAVAGAAIDAQMMRVVGALPTIDPTLEGAARSTLGRMQHDLETLHAKMIQAAKRKDDTLRRQFLHTRALAFPDGEAQERAIGFVSFLNQYGPALVDRLLDDLPLELGHHWVVTV